MGTLDGEVRERGVTAVCEEYGEIGQALKHGFLALRWGADEARRYLQTAVVAGTPAVSAAGSSEFLGEVMEARVEVGFDSPKARGAEVGRVVKVRAKLTEEEKHLLREDFGAMVSLDFTAMDGDFSAAHGLVAASKRIVSGEMFRKVPRGARMIEVGANPVIMVLQGIDVDVYRACIPFLELKDRQRWNSHLRCIQVMLRRTGRKALNAAQRRVAEILVSRPEELVFFSVIQEVRWQAEFIVSSAANWNIPIATVPVVMHNTGARYYYATLDRIPELQQKIPPERGVTRFGMRWQVSVEADRVSCYFDDAQQPYVHKLSVAREYMRLGTREFEVSGRRYVMSEADISTNSQVCLECVDIGRVMAPPMRMGRCVAPGGPAMVQITVPERLVASGGEVVTREIVVEEDMLGRALADRMMSGVKGSVETVLSFCRANRVTVTQNGVRISSLTPLEVDQFRPFAVAVNALALDMLRAEAETMKLYGPFVEAAGDRFDSSVLGMLKREVGSAFSGSTLLSRVAAGIRTVLSGDESAEVRVRRVPEVQHTPSPAMTKYDFGVKPMVAGACYCYERENVARLLGEGAEGLTDSEIYALEGYAAVLSRKTCITCVKVDQVLARVAKEKEAEEAARASELEEQEVFYDCNSESESSTSETLGGSATSVSAGPSSSQDVSSASSSEEEEEVLDGYVDEEALLRQVEELDNAQRERKDVTVATRQRLALEEWVYILRSQVRAWESETRNFFLRMGAFREVSQEFLDSASTVTEAHVLLDVGRDGRIWKCRAKGKSIEKYAHVYDFLQDKFYTVQKFGGARFLPPTASSVVYSSSKYEIWNNPVMIRNVLPSLQPGTWVDREAPVVAYTNGIWGCGKTSGVGDQFQGDGRPEGRLFLSATAKGADELRMKTFGDDPMGKLRVRTYDSVVMWGLRGVEADELVCDEMAALFAGQFLYVMNLVRPKRVRGLGDIKQMSPRPFVSGLFPKYSDLNAFVRKINLPISHRCRLSIAAGALEYYDGETAVCVDCCEHIAESEEGGVRVIPIQSITQIPIRRDTLYMGFSQAESAALRLLLRDANLEMNLVSEFTGTAAESQGRTVKKAIIYRANAKEKKGSLYFEKDRTNVAVSRAKLEVEYYTMCPQEKDEIQQFSERSYSEVNRAKVRENSERFHREILRVGKKEFYRKYFVLEEVQYMDV